MSDERAARQTLRFATAADHAKVDAAFGAFELASREGYCAFLRAQAGAHLPIEAAIDRAACGSPLDDWPERRRAPLLIADLRALGVDAPYPLEVPVFHDAESMLGAVYVLEGSRLGGQFLARNIPARLPQTFLRAGSPGQWRKLIDLLDATLVTKAQLAAATHAARDVFALFEASARRHQPDVIA